MSIKQTRKFVSGQTDIDRREFIKRLSVGLSGAALASAGGLLPVKALANGIELNYTFWPFGDEIIAENARIFTEQYGLKVNLQPTSGDYAAVMETKLVSGTSLDLFRAQRGQASRWFAAQWIRPIDDMPDLDKIKKEEFPGYRRGRPVVARSQAHRPHLLQWRAVLHVQQREGPFRRRIRGDGQPQRLSADLGRNLQAGRRPQKEGHRRESGSCRPGSSRGPVHRGRSTLSAPRKGTCWSTTT